MSSRVVQAFWPAAGLSGLGTPGSRVRPRRSGLPGGAAAVSTIQGWIYMKRIAILLGPFMCCAPVFAAITGTVMNGTTGQPQAGIAVSVLRMTQQGPQPAGNVKADAQG